MAFLRRLSNPLKLNWERSVPSTGDLRPKTKDAIFAYQLSNPDFTRIDAGTLVVAEICGTRAFAAKVLRACEATGIVDPATGYPNTNKIDRSIVAKMPHINLPKQRELVMLLFFHEAEIYRYRVLCVELEEVVEAMGRGGLSDGERVDLWNQLKDIEAQQKILPSWRDGEGRSCRQSMVSGSSTASTELSYEGKK